MKHIYIILFSVLVLLLSCKNRDKNKLNPTSANIDPPDTTLIKKGEPSNYMIDSTSSIEGESVFLSCETYPEFPGGEKALFEYINTNTRYLQSAVNDSIEGRVILKFVIKANGETRDIQVLRSLRYDLDNECIRVIKEMPIWKPARQNGVPVPIWYVIPFHFWLKNNGNLGMIHILPSDNPVIQTLNAKLYPNPASDFINIKLESLPQNLEFNLISLNGQIVKHGYINEIDQRIDLPNLTNGLYILTLKSNILKLSKSYKFTIQN
jgi:TonB family protein